MPEVITPEAPDLAAQVRAGDRRAIQTVVETYLAQILRAARGAGLDPHQAEDVTQATFTTFIEVAPRFEGRSSVRTWLFGILYKKIAEARRGRRRDRQMDEIDEAFESRFEAAAAGAGHLSRLTRRCISRSSKPRSSPALTRPHSGRRWRLS